MVSPASKRPASRTPSPRPSKRPAPSTPEEGEVDDEEPSQQPTSPPPRARSPSLPPKAEASSKVAFPFKKKSLPASSIEPIPKENTPGPSTGPAVYVRPEELDKRIREEEALAPPRRQRGGRNRRAYPQPRQREYWDPAYDRAYPPPYPVDRYYPPPERRYDYSDSYAPPPPERERIREASRSPPSETRGSESPHSGVSPNSSRKEKHRLPAPRSPGGGGFSPLSRGPEPLPPPPPRRRYDERGYYPDERHYDHYGHYRREADDYYRGGYEYGARGGYRDDWNDRSNAWENPRDGYRVDSYRPASPVRVVDTYRPASPHSYRPASPRGPDAYRPGREPEGYRPLSPGAPTIPQPASMEPRATPPPPAEDGPPPPPPLPERRKDDTLPPEHAMVAIPLRAKQEEAEPVVEVKKVAPSKRREPVRRTREEEKDAYGRVFMGCGQQSDYELMTKVGEGTFGEVHKAVNKHSGQVVALKRILMHNEKEGMPVTALREIKILKSLEHASIVRILDMFVVRSGRNAPLSVYMVFPYMDHDLAGLLENERVKLQPSQIKLYMKQLLEGTSYMHRNRILHRDMKAANLLISNSGQLCIADFGLARAYDPSIVQDAKDFRGTERKYTNCVVTRWYRPPELLLGARQYGGEVDLWGIGCVLAEMFTRKPILPGTSDLDQIEKIWALCGTPNQHTWPNFDTLPGCEGVTRFATHARKVRNVYEQLGAETCDLLDKLLVCNPRDRITAEQALDHDYFWTDPLPADPRTLPQYEASHELDKRNMRRHGPPYVPPVPPVDPSGGPPNGGPGGMRLPPPVSNPPLYYNRGPPPRELLRAGGSQPFPPPNAGGPPFGMQGGPPGIMYPPRRGYGNNGPPMGQGHQGQPPWGQGQQLPSRPPMHRATGYVGGPLPPGSQPPQDGGLHYG